MRLNLSLCFLALSLTACSALPTRPMQAFEPPASCLELPLELPRASADAIADHEDLIVQYVGLAVLRVQCRDALIIETQTRKEP